MTRPASFRSPMRAQPTLPHTVLWGQHIQVTRTVPGAQPMWTPKMGAPRARVTATLEMLAGTAEDMVRLSPYTLSNILDLCLELWFLWVGDDDEDGGGDDGGGGGDSTDQDCTIKDGIQYVEDGQVEKLRDDELPNPASCQNYCGNNNYKYFSFNSNNWCRCFNNIKRESSVSSYSSGEACSQATG